MADPKHEIIPHWQRAGIDKALALVDDALFYAHRLGAESLTVKTAGSVYGVYLKLNGREVMLTPIPAELFPAAISRIKFIANLDLSSSTIQNGVSLARIGGKKVEIDVTVSGSDHSALAILKIHRR